MLTLMLAASLRKYVPGYDGAHGLSLEVAGEETVGTIAERLGIPRDEVKLIMINGRAADWGTSLLGDERLALFPPVGGG